MYYAPSEIALEFRIHIYIYTRVGKYSKRIFGLRINLRYLIYYSDEL